MQNLIEKIRIEAKGIFSTAKGSHDWEHTQRVLNLCMHIGKKENANMEILQLAAILHDIGRGLQDKSNGKICHAEKGAILAKGLLKRYNVDEGKINEIIHCIESHRFRNNKAPETREAKILYDADKLDAIGATGIGRAFLFAGEVGAKLHNDRDVNIEKTKPYTKEDTAYREFMVKLKKVKDTILTNEGKRIARERHDFMIKFFDRLNKEIEGEL